MDLISHHEKIEFRGRIARLKLTRRPDRSAFGKSPLEVARTTAIEDARLQRRMQPRPANLGCEQRIDDGMDTDGRG